MICSTCRKDLNTDHFSYKNKKKGILKKICKDCHSDYRRQHYLNNKEKYIEKARKWNRKQGKIIKEYLYKILSQSECIDCGENDILVLEFDHIENKKNSISKMYKNRYSLTAIDEELEKCVVRCANCHRRKTAQESNFWKIEMIKNNLGA